LACFQSWRSFPLSFLLSSSKVRDLAEIIRNTWLSLLKMKFLCLHGAIGNIDVSQASIEATKSAPRGKAVLIVPEYQHPAM
jgi:hypothetical protein